MRLGAFVRYALPFITGGTGLPTKFGIRLNENDVVLLLKSYPPACYGGVFRLDCGLHHKRVCGITILTQRATSATNP